MNRLKFNMKILHKSEIQPDQTINPEQILKLILENRGIENPELFINPASPASLSLQDFGYEKEILKTISLLKTLKKQKKMIVVYTDYDADGITGGSILWETLHLLGFTVMPYVPHRQQEGYGFSIKGIDAVKKKYDPGLIISVDHGITAREKIAYAKSIGIPVIITDHHIKPDLLPDDAVAIFHIPQLSGSGVSYFFSKMLFEQFGTSISGNDLKLAENFKKDYLSLAAIGTIADLVPLKGYSRSIVKYGLDAFKHVNRTGIRHILKQAMIENKPITPYEVGFIIAPRINAIGRLEHAINALRLLCTTNDRRAEELASSIGKTNTDRQELVKDSVIEAVRMIEQAGPINKIIILISDHWHEGVIGLIASKIVEKYFRPAIVMTKSDGFYKGSARSIPALHMTDFLKSHKKFLVDMGGHAQAAGFTIEKNKVDGFIKTAVDSAEKMLHEKDLEKVIEADLKIPVSMLSIELSRTLLELTPFGIGNPNPVFTSDIELLDAKLFGKTQTHLKILVRDWGSRGFPLELIAFSAGEMLSKLTKGMKLSIAFNLEIDSWSGTEKLRGKIVSNGII